MGVLLDLGIGWVYDNWNIINSNLNVCFVKVCLWL